MQTNRFPPAKTTAIHEHRKKQTRIRFATSIPHFPTFSNQFLIVIDQSIWSKTPQNQAKFTALKAPNDKKPV